MDTLAHFVHGIEKLGHRLDARKIRAFERYLHEIRRITHLLGIISTKDLDRIPSRHFLDSLMPALMGILPKGGTIVDIGSGGGLPGIPLAIFVHGTHFELIESSRKKCAFLNLMRRTLRLENVIVCNDRMEKLIERAADRLYDAAVARAVGSIGQLVEWSGPLLKTEGKLICYKGTHPAEEIESARPALESQGMVWEATVPYEVGASDSPTLVVLKKHETVNS